MKFILRYRFSFLPILFIFSCTSVFSLGKDSSRLFSNLKFRNSFLTESISKDSVKIKKKWSVAKKATMLSVIFPGLGQAYNKKYWKLPIVYVALGGLGYSIVTNNKQYYIYHNALLGRPDGITQADDPFPQYSNDNLVTLKRYYRKFRDLSIMGAAMIYVLQIIDANVDGHLTNFDVDNISFNISPYNSIGKDYSKRNYNGISLTMKF